MVYNFIKDILFSKLIKYKVYNTNMNIPLLEWENSIALNSTKEIEQPLVSQTIIKPRKRRNTLPEIEENLRELLQRLRDGKISVILSSEKGDTGLPNYNSERRSKFIGVSKNGKNWQVLINVDNEKKYIGTYLSQKEAAVTYDLYSFALHGPKAKTNFTYSALQLLRLVEEYLETKTINYMVV